MPSHLFDSHRENRSQFRSLDIRHVDGLKIGWKKFPSKNKPIISVCKVEFGTRCFSEPWPWLLKSDCVNSLEHFEVALFRLLFNKTNFQILKEFSEKCPKSLLFDFWNFYPISAVENVRYERWFISWHRLNRTRG